MTPDSAALEDVPEDSSLRLRPAVADDLEAIVALKLRLRLRPDGASETTAKPAGEPDRGGTGRGGFLLGASRERYAWLIERGRTRVLCDEGRIVGFTAALADAELRASELWRRREQIDLGERGLLAALDHLPVGYLDQLAVTPDRRYLVAGVALAYEAVAGLFAGGCALVCTTVVSRPVRNLASRPLLAAVGALQIGTLDEDDPDVGRITSDVFAIPAAALDPAAIPGDLVGARRRSRLHQLASLVARLTRE